MTINELTAPFKDKFEKTLGPKLKEIAVNCISLCETWMANAKSKTLMFKLLDGDGNIIKSLYGLTPDNLTTELFIICLEKPESVRTVDVLCLVRDGLMFKQQKLGALDIN